MAGSSSFGNLARVAKVLALLFFLLPWVTVTCSPDALTSATGGPGAAQAPSGLSGGIPIARGNGLQLATGTVSMVTDSFPQSEGNNSSPPPDFKPEIGVIAGAALIVLALLATFLIKGRAGAVAAAGGSALAIVALCYSVFVSVPQAARALFASSGSGPGGGAGGPTAEQIAQIIQVNAQIGFYLTILALVAAVVLNVLALQKAGAAPQPVAAPPPPAEPPPGV